MRIPTVFFLLIVMIGGGASASAQTSTETPLNEYPLTSDGAYNATIRMVDHDHLYQPMECGVFYFLAPDTDIVDFLEGRPETEVGAPTAYTDRDGIARARLEPNASGVSRDFIVLYGPLEDCPSGLAWTTLDGFIRVGSDGIAAYIPYDQGSSNLPPFNWQLGVLTVYG